VDQADVQFAGWYGVRLNPADEVQHKVLKFLSNHFSYYFDIGEAFDRVRQNGGRFVAIVDGLDAEYLVSKQGCDLLLLRDELFPIEYKFICHPNPMGSSLCEKLSQGITSLQENGVIYSLKKHWWSPSSVCEPNSEDNYITIKTQPHTDFVPYGPTDVFLPFVILIFGTSAVVGVWVFKALCKARSNPKRHGSFVSILLDSII